ncbi:lytic transglycosylase domain-containing protein [Paenibacillus cisolokensis]|uniref:lytic transglycosylase domain-containing protein n=1 Tax=Paenibacillus cisolokensis TaxID=1658519 RepID=UPI003D280052
MQIDPVTYVQSAATQRATRSNAEETAVRFSDVLQQAVNEESSEEATRTVRSLPPGVTYEDGLLWQHLGKVDTSMELGQASFQPENTRYTSFEELITAAGERYGVPVSLIKSVIQIESAFNPNAVSSAGAKGLMQLMDGTARGLGVSDSFDPVQNIDGGTRYLSNLLQRFGGEIAVALAAYNAGPTRVASLGITTDEELMASLHVLPAETQAYVQKVMDARRSYTI